MKTLLPLSGLCLSMLLCVGCAPAVSTLGPSAVFQVERGAGERDELRSLDQLSLPPNGMLHVTPTTLSGVGAPEALQLVLRFHHRDGAVSSWVMDGQEATGGAEHHFSHPETGGIATRDLVGMEVWVARRAAVDPSPVLLSGAAGVVGASDRSDFRPEGALARERHARRGGASLALVGRVAIAPSSPMAPGEVTTWLGVVEAKPLAGRGPGEAEHLRLQEVKALRRDDGGVADGQGQRIDRMAVLLLRLRLKVIDHTLRPPPGENLKERDPDRDDRRRDPLKPGDPRGIGFHVPGCGGMARGLVSA